ncbi:unnamed protein product [Prorocentrum cordatum]|uniref:Uncharacterized protein n=1 Tax=Prorocentrum cordatum TaxID=2364126 RepID=A0ABN9RN33_9DINO|nr:unnamed protein product [Polarella glacialis]
MMPRSSSATRAQSEAAGTQPSQAQRSTQEKAPADRWRSPPRRVKVGGQWLPKPPQPAKIRIPWRRVESSAPAADNVKSAKVFEKKAKKRKQKDQSARNPFANLKGHIDGSQKWKLKDCQLQKWKCEDCAKRLKKKVVLFGFRVQCPFCRRLPPSPIREKQMAAIRKINREEFERQRALRKQLASATAASPSTCPKVTVQRARKKNAFLKKIKQKRKHIQGKQAMGVKPSVPQAEGVMVKKTEKDRQLEDIDAMASQQQTTKDNLSELIESLQPALHKGTEEAQSSVKALTQQAEKTLTNTALAGQSLRDRGPNLRETELELPAVPAFPSLHGAGDDLEFSLEDFLAGKKLQYALEAASTPDAQRIAMLDIKPYVFRLSLGQAPQQWGARLALA